MERKLQKDPTNKVIAGVCSGLGKYLGVDVTLMRVIFAILTLAGGPGLLLYIVLAIVMKNPPTEYEAEQENRF